MSEMDKILAELIGKTISSVDYYIPPAKYRDESGTEIGYSSSFQMVHTSFYVRTIGKMEMNLELRMSNAKTIALNL